MKRLLLMLCATVSAHAYYPEWVRTGVTNFFTVLELDSADFDGDGRPDLLVRTVNRELLALTTGADGKPGEARLVLTSEYLNDAVIGDFDGNGKVDVVAADIAANALLFARGNGDGTFSPPLATPLTFSPSELAAGDFTGDGRPDLAIRSLSAATLTVYRGNGAGGFAEASRVAVPASSYAIRSGDVDHDGRRDVLLAREEPQGFDLYFGKGDGTFDAPVPFAASSSSRDFALTDLDADGDAEILSTQFEANTLTIHVNLGSRTFAAPVPYTLIVDADGDGNPYDLVVGEFTGDAHADVLVSLTSENRLATLAGNGNGSLGKMEHVTLGPGGLSSFLPGALVTGDFDGDARTDVAVGSLFGGGVAIHANRNGDVRFFAAFPKYPVVSAGQSPAFTVWLTPVQGHRPAFDYPPLVPTGPIAIKEGATVLGTGTLNHLYAVDIAVAPLPIGTHTLVATYGGDANYRAGVSHEIVQKVVAEQSVVTLLSDSADEVEYGDALSFSATVDSPLPGDKTGTFWFFIDGVRQPFTVTGPPGSWSENFFPPGTHTFYVEYEGNATQPPSRSNVVTRTIRKARSTTHIDLIFSEVAAGKSLSLRVQARGNGSRPTGVLRVYEGTRLLREAIADESSTVDIVLPPFQEVGPHTIHATYGGDVHHEPSVSEPVTITVTPGPVIARRRSVRG